MDRHSDRHHIVDIQLGCINNPSVVAAKTADGLRGGSDLIVVPALPPPASKEGSVGAYWYHGDTTAYFHDEQQDQEASDACKKRRPSYLLWVYFVVFYGFGIALGAVLGSSFASGMKGGKAMKVLVFVLGMCIPLSVISFLWCPFACSKEEVC